MTMSGQLDGLFVSLAAFFFANKLIDCELLSGATLVGVIDGR